MKKLVLLYLVGSIILLQNTSCSKSDFLNKKPDNSLLIPSTVSDFQTILDNDNIVNGSNNGIVPSFVENGADDFYVEDNVFKNNLSPVLQGIYTWAKEPYPNTSFNDWNLPYLGVNATNTVITGLKKIKPSLTDQNQYNTCLGSAYFLRAHIYFHLAQAFCLGYDPDNAKNVLGVPLLLTGDINEKLVRVSLWDTYKQIESDLLLANETLPTSSNVRTRPVLASSFALLARLYLSSQNYEEALKYANLSLEQNSNLLDYNSLDTLSNAPFASFNKEVIFHSIINYPISVYYGYVDTLLYRSYENDDLRKKLFFSSIGRRKAGYDGTGRFFGGIANDEVYLIKSECEARVGSFNEGMATLNKLLKTRYINGKFVDRIASSKEEALAIILQERRKELVFRGLRWSDLKRFNIEGKNVTIKRIVNGQTYILEPNDPRYAWPIPDNIIAFNPGMPQNPR